jgi:hypothetical protein
MGRESNLNPFARNTQVPAVVRDVTGREVVEGDEIVLNTNCQAPLFRVLKIAPVVDPNAPPGLLQVDLVCRWRFHSARLPRRARPKWRRRRQRSSGRRRNREALCCDGDD